MSEQEQKRYPQKIVFRITGGAVSFIAFYVYLAWLIFGWCGTQYNPWN